MGDRGTAAPHDDDSTPTTRLYSAPTLLPCRTLAAYHPLMATSAKQSNVVQPTAVEAREGYRIWLSFSDGVAGEIDLTHLAGDGVFEPWNDRACFESVRLTSYGAVAWTEDAELCAEALYIQLTGVPAEELMPLRRPLGADA